MAQCKLNSLMPYTNVIKVDVRQTRLTETSHHSSPSLVRDSEILAVLLCDKEEEAVPVMKQVRGRHKSLFSFAFTSFPHPYDDALTSSP